jgi:hypothetical protein
MKTLRLRSILRSAWLLAVAPALAAGCSSASGDGAEGAVSQQGSDLSKSPCDDFPAPKGRACNTVVCQGDDWAYKAEAPGSRCVLPTGQAGVCVGAVLGTCESIATGVIYPKYSILSVQYAPPGAASTVDYGDGTTFETTTTNSSSFTNELNVTVSANSGVLGWVSGGISVSSGTSSQTTSTNTLDIKEVTQTDFTIDGDQDAVDHGLDRIYLWLNPEMDATIVGTNEMTWSLAVRAGQNPEVLYVTPTWLLNGTTPSDVLSALAAAGITQADYAQILSVDPFASNGAAAIDTTRFVYQTELPYEAVTVAGQMPTTEAYSLQSSMTGKTGSESKVSYNVGVTVSATANFLGLFDGGLKVADQMTWTSDNSVTIANGTTVSATATITQPAFGYDGPVFLDVYYDTVYDTFLFVLPQGSGTSGGGRGVTGGGIGTVGAAP